MQTDKQWLKQNYPKDGFIVMAKHKNEAKRLLTDIMPTQYIDIIENPYSEQEAQLFRFLKRKSIFSIPLHHPVTKFGITIISCYQPNTTELSNKYPEFILTSYGIIRNKNAIKRLIDLDDEQISNSKFDTALYREGFKKIICQFAEPH